jgi:dienelactone hydrolase
MPILRQPLGEHPQLLEADRCSGRGKTRVLLTYRRLDCAAYGGENVIAPRLIHPRLRERVRRMGYPFGLVPLGFELAYGAPDDAARLFGAEVTRPEELAFGMGIARHDESVVERATEDVRRIEEYLQGLIPVAEAERARRMREPEDVARRWLREAVGELPVYRGPLAVEQTVVEESAAWTAVAVRFAALDTVGGYGILLRPKGMRTGERRPLVVAQHGLEGRPQFLYGRREDEAEFKTYRNFAERLVAEGFVVYLPQNPYRGDFRRLQLLAHPRGVSLLSFIRAQYGRMLDWVATLPEVDAGRIGYYGLSYGGWTALRVPVFDARFRAVVCGGNFNEWIRKLTSPELKYSYVPTKEYEMFEWRQAWIASHAELAAMARRLGKRRMAFLVERGRRDPVGEDRWVEYEFARLRGYVGGDPAVELAYFDGEHRTDGEAAIPFLKRWLR